MSAMHDRAHMVDEVVEIVYESGTAGVIHTVSGRCVAVADGFVIVAPAADRRDRIGIPVHRVVEMEWQETKRR